ncbi:MAG: aa3-type cytochrome c oxidase subunit IV [Pseudomonadota bacterium]
MAEEKFEPGKMDISDQEKTFAGFMRFATNTTIGIIVFLIFLYLIAG